MCYVDMESRVLNALSSRYKSMQHHSSKYMLPAWLNFSHISQLVFVDLGT